MIPAITEVNFPSYATLSQANVSLQEMGERTISTQIKIDGGVVPSFDGWELSFKGERFILPVKEPQAAKDNTSRRSTVDLTFESWVVFQLKRYFFASMSQIDSGTAIPDQYNASVILPIEGFVQLFNKVLQHYFGSAIRMDLFGAGTAGLYSQEPVTVEINKTYIWDVLAKFYELFGYRWRIEYDSQTSAYVIKVNYTAPAITDHDFEYGYKGGLLRFERQVQDTQISNILIGRGGEKNLPYRYFKLQDPASTAWAADPDAIPELANVYFDRLRDANFRWYVRGWMQNSHRDTSWDATHTFPTYTDADCPEPFLFAFHKGQTDEKFNPVEYVKDDASILKYGERWGAVDDNDEAYPTIQGREITGLGRIDEVVDVSPIVTDDIDAAAKAAATYIEIGGNKTVTFSLGTNSSDQVEMTSEPFTVPSDNVGNILHSILNPFDGKTGEEYPEAVVAMDTSALNLRAVEESTGTEYPATGLAPGTYRLKFTLKATNYSSQRQSYVTFGLNTLQLVLSSADADAWKPTFDIWVKNIWQTQYRDQAHPNETPEEYSTRVWQQILGDRAGNEAKVVFSTGFMSTSEDYEFVIASYPVFDQSKTITSGGVNYNSEWKITLRKCDAEFEATGLYIPNATTGGKPSAGDHFFFIGIDMPFQYVVWGEEFLNGALNTPVVNKTAALENLAEINPTWLIQLDKVRCNTHEGAEYGQHLADRLQAGATVRIKDKRFTGGQVLTLYVQTINYVWNEPSDGSPYLVPDIEVTLSDKVVSSEGVVTRVSNELEVVKTTYAKSADIEQVVRQVGGALFLKKTGESDRSASPTSFASAVNSENFRQGDFGGAGWGHYEDGDGDSVLELDKLVIRKELRVNELVSNQIAYVGGKSIRSAASIQCTQVVEDANYYYCYFDQKQGTVKNLFVVGDFAMGQDFDESNAETRYYRMSVTGVGVDYIRLSKAGRDGQGAPQKGDTIVQYGNSSVAGRQYVIIEDVIGGGLQRMLSGLNSVSAAGKEYYFAGKQNNGERWFVGDANGEHAEWKNGQLNVKGRFSVLKQDGTYESMSDYINSMDYLRAATNEGTLIDGGLVLTSMIQLGYTANQVYHVMAGINGKPDETLSDQTKSIAAWFGGPMVDKDAAGSGSGSGTGDSYAKTLFRMDGSGYLAGGNIYWNKQGYGGIPGVTWSREGVQDIVTIGGNVKLVSASGDTVTELLTAVQSLTSMFEDETYVDGSQTKHRIKVKSGYAGLYAEGFLTAGGIGSGGGGGEGVGLPEVWQSLMNTAYPNYANNKIAPAHLFSTDPAAATGLILGQGLSYNPNTRVLSVSTLGTVTSVAGESPVNGDVPVASLRTALGLGDAAYKGIGSVANGNTDLVTGGSVYSAINSAISSAIKFQGITTTPLTDGSTTQTITIDGESYTAQRGDEVIYGGKEFLWTGSKWQQLGDEESWALKTVSITGTGYLTGGGTLEQNRTIDLTSAAGTKLENGATAYGWGNHANAGYLLATTAANTYATITDLNGVSGRVTTLENRQNWDDIFGIDFDGNVYVKKRTVSGQEIARGFYSYSFVTAGGVGSGGGGGGGVDLPRVWQSLTNASALVEYGTSTKIHTDHFPTISAANGLTASYGTPSGSGATLATYLNLGVSSGYKLPTTSEWSSKADASALNDYLPKAGGTMDSGANVNFSGFSLMGSGVTTSNTGAAKIGAYDRASYGGLCVQLGNYGGTASEYNCFDVVDNAWSKVRFHVHNNGLVRWGENGGYYTEISGGIKINSYTGGSTNFNIYASGGDLYLQTDTSGNTTDLDHIYVHYNNGWATAYHSGNLTAATLGALTSVKTICGNSLVGSGNVALGAEELSWGSGHAITTGTIYVRRTGQDINFGTANVSASIGVNDNSTPDWYLWGETNASFFLGVNQTEMMRVTTSSITLKEQTVINAAGWNGQLHINNTTANQDSLIGFYRDGTYVGAIGVSDDDSPVFNVVGVGNGVLLHSRNYSSYALPLSGGTMSGDVSFAGFALINNSTTGFGTNSGTARIGGGDRAPYGGFCVQLGHYGGIASGSTAFEVIDNAWTKSVFQVKNTGHVHWGASGDYYTHIAGGIEISNYSSGWSGGGICAYVGGSGELWLRNDNRDGSGYAAKILISNGTNWGTVYHSLNCNNSSTSWEASSLTLHGAASGVTNIDSILYFDTTNLRVGVGTNSPSVSFHAYNGGSGWTAFVQNSYSSSRWTEVYLSSPDLGILVESSGNSSSNYLMALRYNGGSNTALLVRQDGNVGIGKISPEYKLDVSGSIKTDASVIFGSGFIASASTTNPGANTGAARIGAFDRASGGGIGIQLGNYGQANGDWRRCFYINDAAWSVSLFSVDESGNTMVYGSLTAYGTLSIGGVATFSSTIHAVGGIDSNSYVTAGAAQSASDSRLKGNIRDLQRDPIALIKLLRPREWDWNQYSTVQGHAMGFVAQEVQNYLPFMIGSVKDKHLGNRLTLGYDQFHALWAAGLQNHESRIDKLERENKEFRKENSELKQKVQELQNRLQTINN